MGQPVGLFNVLFKHFRERSRQGSGKGFAVATLNEWLDEFAAKHGEVRQVYVSAGSSWDRYNLDDWPEEAVGPCCREEAGDVLDISFDDGYGSPGCPAVTAWSDEWVFAVVTYDGSTGWFALPRNPTAFAVMPGG